MEKYVTITHIALQEFLAYRLNFLLWRFRNVLNLLLIYFLWTNVFSVEDTLFGYTQTQIVSYIMATNVLSALVFSTKTNEIADQILTGKILNPLLKPFNYFGYVGSRETADKILNVTFSIIEITGILLILRPTLVFELGMTSALQSVLFVINGMIISFFISFILSLFAFWSPDVWGPKFIYFVLTSLLAGIMFPLDVLPTALYQLLLLTPFPYMVFVPSKIAVFGSIDNVILLYAVSCTWICTLFFVTRFLWRKGMREFSFFGK